LSPRPCPGPRHPPALLHRRCSPPPRHTRNGLFPTARKVDKAVVRRLGTRRWVLDGMHIEATEHRLAVLRDLAAGPRPGFALAVYDAERGPVVHALFEPDGHAQERSRSDDVLALVQPGEGWMGDRNFCTQRLLCGILARHAHPPIRQHAHLPYT